MTRILLFPLLLCLSWSGVLSAQLDTISTDVELEVFEEALDAYMNESGNRRAKEAYADFTGSFYGGGYTEEQQREIVVSTRALALAGSPAERGMADFLDIHQYLGGGDEDRQELFAGFHDMLQALLAGEEIGLTNLHNMLSGTLNYLGDDRLGTRSDNYGWRVGGGRPRFSYDADRGPLLSIDTVAMLRGRLAQDSIEITETELYVNLITGEATGKGGRTDWKRVGLPGEVFVRLVDYQFDAARNWLRSDSAHFQYPDYLGDRILYGTFEDRLQSGGPRPKGTVPKFVSDKHDVTITNIGEGISLRGRMELRASRFYATTEEGSDRRVSLVIRDAGGGRQMRGLGSQFIVDYGKRITGQSVDVALYFEEDSLTHPSVAVDIDVPERVVELKRTDSSTDRGPFYHSRNKFNIDADNISVYLNQDSAVVGRRTVSFQEKGPVNFESLEYFDKRDYARVQSLAGFNPLDLIYKYRNALAFPSDTLYIDPLAERFGEELTGKDIESAIFDLQNKGFLTYDQPSGKIVLRPKLAHFVLSMREAKDYDRLRLVSETKVENAFIDLQAGTIRVDGVQPLQLNRERKIAIQPYGDQISVLGDRNLEFSGKVYAGGAIMSGKDFRLKYEPYYIEFDSVSYIDLFIPEGGEFGEDTRLLSTASRIENASGYLLIDAPKNKSGTEDIPYFPSLQTRGPSYIYYDLGDSMSLYSRDSFYFELAPFSINKLDSLTAGDLALEGELVSGGIFPRMAQTLSIQEDGSLGFVTDTDSLGQGTYSERGTYAGQVTLNNQGLTGSGKLSYLEAEIESDDFVFGVDSTTTTTETFRLKQSVTADRSVPRVEGASVDIALRPYGDSLVVRPKEGADFKMFDELDKNFTGQLVLTPDALRGNGTLDWSQATLTSDSIDFAAGGVSTDTATLAIKSTQEEGAVALRSTSVAAEVDFNNSRATFNNNTEELGTELPYIGFQTNSDEFTWDLATGNVTFRTGEGQDRFTSINPDQDSLTFRVTTAEYDNLSSELRAGGVPFVISADARIIPADSSLIIGPGGDVAQLTGATIVADTANEYHTIARATVDILGAKEYTASGFYQYNVGPHQQEFELQEIVGTRVGKGRRSEKETATRATGSISADSTLFIDHKTKFYGDIQLNAGSKELAFEGYARIEDESLPSAQWFTVAGEGDKNDLVLETQGVKGQDGKPLNTGFYLSKPRRQIYPSFIQTLERRVDPAMLTAEGVFKYDEERNLYLFGDSARVDDPTATVGNLMTYAPAEKKVTGSGIMGIGDRLEYVSFKSYGEIAMELPVQIPVTDPDPAPASAPDEPAAEEEEETMFLLEEETEEPTEEENAEAAAERARIQAMNRYPDADVQLMAAIDLILPPELIQVMVTDIVSGSYSAPNLAVNTRIDFTTAAIQNLFPEGPDREAAIAGLPADAVDLPASINSHTLLFSDLRMRWNNEYQSWVTTHASNGLASIAGQPISRRMESYVEVKMTSAGEDRMYIYLKSPSETWYFLGYKDGILNVVSNNNRFMNTLRDLKPREVVLEMDDGQTYEILEVTPSTASTFLRRAQTAFTAQ